MFIASLFTREARGGGGRWGGGGESGICERNKTNIYFALKPPTQSSLRFALASSSFTILSSRSTIESKYEEIEGCE